MFIEYATHQITKAPEGRHVNSRPRIDIMADTYTQLYIHIVFAVKGRQSLIPKQHKAELHKYITGVITGKNQKVIQINSMPDHIHILIGMTPEIALSDLVRDIKANSSKLINKNRWVMGRFEWQTGFAACYKHVAPLGIKTGNTRPLYTCRPAGALRRVSCAL